TLDPAKDHALKQYSLIHASGRKILHSYGDYQLIADNWCPASILIERYETTETGESLTATDLWGLTSISAQTPPDDGFDVTYEFDAYIEDLSVGGGPLAYRQPDPKPPSPSSVDADELITSRLMIASADDEKVRNCATAAMKYVADELGKDVTLSDVTQMLRSEESETSCSVEQPTAKPPSFRPKGRSAARSGEIYSNKLPSFQPSTISLLAVQQAAEKLGLHTKAVKTDIAALRDLIDCRAILHLPETNHFVVLGDVDDKYVRLIDLVNDRFYYRQPIDSFRSAWDGTTLLVANKPIPPPPCFAKIDAPSLAKILGGCPSQLCNIPCSDGGELDCIVIAGLCMGPHTILIHRSCCGAAPSGICYDVALVYKKEESCGENPITGDCEGEGDWTNYYMQACQ
ncbi:MAG: cysteine peptidase family C39 domain-containing protein, partial [Planctomycetota bacterium]